MQIRRFEAKTMTVALRMVKEELGPEAVILSARSLKRGSGVFGTVKNVAVEVTAATDTYYPSARKAASLYAKEAAAEKPAGPPAETEKLKRKGMWPSFQGGLKGLTGRRRTVSPPVKDLAEIEKMWTRLFQHFLSQEIQHETAGQLIEAIKNIANPDDVIEERSVRQHLADIFEQMGVVAGRAIVSKKTPRILALTGSCGVGKTTTIAKLAAQQAVDRKKNVALINLDNYRIGANEQLKVYARILGIPLATAGSPAEFKAMVKEFSKKDLILIDTPGISQKNSSQIETLIEYFGTLKSIEVHLLLGAATKEKILMDTITRFKDLSTQRLIFTKVDESPTYGSLVNLSLQSKIALSFLTTGRQIPEDLEVCSSDNLADLILNSTTVSTPLKNKSSNFVDAATGADSSRHVIEAYLVANKNSDVYHNPNCKWAQKIKPENVIEFRSAAEAEMKKFMPCRNCNAEQMEKLSNNPPTRDRMRISSYR
jgi:flagellar biosynthesis protein FlhF